MRRHLLRLLVVAFAAASPGPAVALTVSLAPGAGASELEVDVFRDAATPCCVFSQALTALPASGQLSIPPVPPLIPPFEATVDYGLTSAGFAFDYRTTREDAEDNHASVRGTVFFSVDEAVGFALSGSYVLDDPVGDLAFFDVVLEDLTSASILYQTILDNSATPDAMLILGDPTFEIAGAGSPVGTLQPGHDYRLSFEVSSDVFPGPPTPSGAVDTGVGTLTLAFVPEPGAGPLLLLGALALAAAGRAREAG